MGLQIEKLEKTQEHLPQIIAAFVDPAEKFLMAELQNGKRVVLAEIVSRDLPQVKRGRKPKATSNSEMIDLTTTRGFGILYGGTK